MRVLFWNTNKNGSINNVILDLIIENNISVVALAEYEASIEDLLYLLSANGIIMQSYLTSYCPRITMIGAEKDITSGRQTDYASFQIKNNKDILCCLHLQSKIYGDNERKREITIDQIKTDLISTENEFNTKNAIIFGDFNIDPYEFGCLAANKFHGIPYFEIAQKQHRTISGQQFEMFYNPMWSFYGDRNKPYGTYYSSANDTCTTFWKLYDQVIISPSLRNRFIDSSLQIVTETESTFLLNSQGQPKKNISDHLPIIFEIQEENHGTEV